MATKESNTRSWAKSLSWRVFATTTTIIVSYIFLGDIQTALKIGPVDFVVKFLVFYLHERLYQLAWLTQLCRTPQRRLVIKTSTWKVLAFAMTTATSVWVTGRWDVALRVGPTDFFAKLFLYTAHEMMWEVIRFGVVDDSTPPPKQQKMGKVAKKD